MLSSTSIIFNFDSDYNWFNGMWYFSERIIGLDMEWIQAFTLIEFQIMLRTSRDMGAHIAIKVQLPRKIIYV